MANEDFVHIIDQLKQEFTSAAVAPAISSVNDDAIQADLNDVATFVDSICEDFQNFTQVMELKITQQPQSSFSFRFKSQIKASHGHLKGQNTNGKGCKKYPGIELRQFGSIEHADNSAGYFIRCSLHQPLAEGETRSFISPHLLYRRYSKAADYAEMEMFPCIEVAPLVHSFTLENFTILKTARKDWFQVLIHKMRELQDKDLPLTGINKPRELHSREDFEKIANEQIKKPQNKVRLCFEAFRRITHGYLKVAGPTYSECIRNGDPPHIELCNTSAAMHELTMMTLKVNTVRPKDKIRIFHDSKNHNGYCIDTYETSHWQISITIEEEMIHEQSALVFQMPIHRGIKRKNGQEVIKCGIQLERLSDGARSNKATFYYINTMKRLRDQLDDKVELIKVQRLISDAAVNLKSFKTKSTLEKLLSFYEESIIMVNEQKSKFVQDVREYYRSYELAHSDGNSILHDILLDADPSIYDTQIDLMIKHLELQDLVGQSMNIYGETVLMFACMFNRPLLMKSLIDMGSSLTAQDAEHGNNVLHIAMQQQSGECRNCLIQAMKTNKSSTSFIKALGSHNLRGMTPLHMAVLQNNVSIVVELLEFCKRQNAYEVCQLGQLSDGNTILHLAVLNRFSAMRACILQHSGDSFKNLINYADSTAEDLERTVARHF